MIVDGHVDTQVGLHAHRTPYLLDRLGGQQSVGKVGGGDVEADREVVIPGSGG